MFGEEALRIYGKEVATVAVAWVLVGFWRKFRQK
jgi:hypothetical protein